MRAVIIAGTHSGCGKTTIALGLMAAYKSKGFNVQPFKCGPDFIDAGLHRLITGVPSRNLDIWMCGEGYVKECFYKYSQQADISIIEGVMGMYDGKYSTATIAKILNIPIILVLDAYGIAESAGAMVKGFVEYWNDNTTPTPPLNKWRTSGGVIGVIFNRVSSEKHFMRIKKSIRGVKVLGYLPRNLDFQIPHRHLGLLVAEENPIEHENLNRLVDSIHKYIDLDTIMSECYIKTPPNEFLKASSSIKSFEMANCQPQFKRIAVAYDKAFCFYYDDNLEKLRNSCAEIVQFSPLEDFSLPDSIDAIYIGGGYPEVYAERLSNNKDMLKEILDWSQSDMPLYAECGGLMYLSKGIYDENGRFFKMAGVFPFDTSIRLNRRAFLGYRQIVLKEDCLLGYKGSIIRGHEFHYSEIMDKNKNSDLTKIYSVVDNDGEPLDDEGYLHKNTLASYTHIHFGSNVSISDSFINFIKKGKVKWKESCL